VHLAFALLTLFPGRVGGSESAVRGLLGEFAAGNGPERVTVLANRHAAGPYADFARGPVRVHEVGSYRAGASDLTRLAAIATAGLMRRRTAGDVPAGIDVVHHPLTVPIPIIDGVPTVTTLHDMQHHDLPSFFSRSERAYRRWAYDGAARRATVVITPSEYTRRRLLELEGLAPENVEAVPAGIDHHRFNLDRRDADDSLGRRRSFGERYVVYPANLWPHKNHARLIDALAAARDRELQLVLTGRDYGRGGQLREHARLAGVAERVRHLGYLERDEMPALLRGATAMVFPSLYEGFGSPPLEAMACGCPVASSAAGSLAEAVGEAALVFDPASVESIADAIDRVTGEAGLREKLRAAGLERARRYSWSRAAARHRSIYERAAATLPPMARSR
jgi:glycosyltransferase involved in cell wall biosynthesis